MIDLHTHVLPGIDDGPADVAGSVAMVRVAAGSGTETLVATPHLRADHPGVRAVELASRVAELNDVLQRQAVGVRVVPGAEVAITAAAELSADELRAVTLAGNGRDLLVETPDGPLPYAFEPILTRLAGFGFRLTLAHPERNPTFQSEPERLGRLVAQGVLVQMTASSLSGGKRSRARRLAVDALHAGWIHVLASDGHSADWRPPDLRPGLEAARQLASDGGGQVGQLVRELPAAILAGRELPQRPLLVPGAPARRVWWRR